MTNDNEELLPCPHENVAIYVTAGRLALQEAYWSCVKCGTSFVPLLDHIARTRLSDSKARATAEKLVASVLQLPFASVNTVAYDALIDRITALLTKGI